MDGDQTVYSLLTVKSLANRYEFQYVERNDTRLTLFRDICFNVQIILRLHLIFFICEKGKQYVSNCSMSLIFTQFIKNAPSLSRHDLHPRLEASDI